MTDQQEFDLLRETCSAALRELISAAHDTELRMHLLELPVAVETARQFSSQRRAEVQAHEAYLASSNHLAAFVQQHLYIIN